MMKTDRFSGYVSRRLTLRGESSKPVPAVMVAVGGVALAVAVMLISIAVSTGFQQRIKDKIMGFDAQISITPVARIYSPDDNPPFYAAGKVEAMVRRVLNKYQGAEVARGVTSGGVLKTDTDFSGMFFRSHLGSADSLFIVSNLVAGRLPADSVGMEIALSSTVARRLELVCGDKVNAYFIDDSGVRPRRFTLTGIYDSNFGEYDNLVAYASYAALARLQGLKLGEAHTLRVSGIPYDDINRAAMELQRALSKAYASGEIDDSLSVQTVFASGAMYFSWLELLDTNVVVILVLMACVSGFMLISCVLILILQRVRMIGILKALGARDSQIRGIFLRLGLRVTLIGMALGNALGLALVFVQGRWQLIPLDPQSYYLSAVPVELHFGQWMWLNIGVMALSLLLILLPAMLVARLSPVKSISFE